jgi:FKBP-type peptidyl-prolyl cis-trans isomerase FklB
MKAKFLTFIVAVSGLFSLHAQEETSMDSVSYSLGVLMAQNLKQQGFDELDAGSMAAAINDVLSGAELKVTPDQANGIIQQYMTDKQAAEFADVKAAGEDFLAGNAQRPEVTVTESGLQYEVLQPGAGVKPTSSNRVTVHYHGTLVDGTVFDSSVERGQPATFGVTQVIQGWVEGLQLMPLGAKYRFYIPYDLAYGERGAGPKIPPFSALVFEVELLEIN